MQIITLSPLDRTGASRGDVAGTSVWMLHRLPEDGTLVSIGTYLDLEVMAETLRHESLRHDAGILVRFDDLLVQSKDFLDLCENMTTRIHQAMDDAGAPDDPEARSDLFDAHPWAALREALVSSSPEYGGEDVIRVTAIRGDAIASTDGAEAWRVSGPGGPEEDFEAAPDAATSVAMRLARTQAPIRVITGDGVAEAADLDGIVDVLTGMISDVIPDLEENDARDDDFDCHPLSEIREAFADLAPSYHGGMPQP
jgi:hypothetical protein